MFQLRWLAPVVRDGLDGPGNNHGVAGIGFGEAQVSVLSIDDPLRSENVPDSGNIQMRGIAECPRISRTVDHGDDHGSCFSGKGKEREEAEQQQQGKSSHAMLPTGFFG